MDRSERRNRREKVIKRAERFLKNMKTSYISAYVNKWNPSRYAKRKPFDCGTPGCYCCHHPGVTKHKDSVESQHLKDNME